MWSVSSLNECSWTALSLSENIMREYIYTLAPPSLPLAWWRHFSFMCPTHVVVPWRKDSLLRPHFMLLLFLSFQVLPFPSQVVYNRVGKCGSRTVVLLLRILSEKHGFNLVTSDIHNKTRLTKNEQVSWTSRCQIITGGCLTQGILHAEVSIACCVFFVRAQKEN